MENLTETVKQLHDEILNVYNKVCGVMMEITPPIKSKDLSNEDMVDIGYLLRETENMLNEMRKEVKVRKELCGSLIAYNRTKDAVADPSINMKVTGKIATGTPDVKMQAALPKKGTPEYLQFCDHLGVPRSVAEAGVLKLDWNQVTEFCTQQLADGKSIPQGLGKKYPQYVTVYRKKA